MSGGETSLAHSPLRDSEGPTKSRELREHGSRKGRHAGSGGGTRGSQGRRPGKRALDPAHKIPLKPLSEIAPQTPAATSPRRPGLVRLTLAPERRPRAQGGQRLFLRGPAGRDAGNPTSPARAERANPPGAGAGAGAADEVPLSGNFSGLGPAGPARCAAPEPREPETLSAAAYLAPRSRRGAHPRSSRGSVSCAGARSRRARVGGAGRDAASSSESAGTRPAAAHTVRHQLKAPAPPPPAPVAGRPAWDEGALCIKTAVTSRGARARRPKRRGLGPGAGPEEEEARPGNRSRRGRSPGKPVP